MKSSTKWLQRIFRWEVAGVVIAAVSLIYAYKSFKIDEGGELQITSNFPTSDNTGDIAVVTDATDLASTLNQLLPEFRNSIKYSLKNFNLTYDITTSEPVNFTFSPDFSMRQVSPTRLSATLADHTLYAHSQVEAPFVTATPSQNNFNMTVAIRATFDGAAEPYAATYRYRFYPTSALNTLKERTNHYAYILESYNDHLTEINITPATSQSEAVTSESEATKTTTTGKNTTAVENTTSVYSQKPTFKADEGTSPQVSNIESKHKNKTTSWVYWFEKYKWIIIVVGGILFIILVFSDSSAMEAVWDDIHTWPWKPKEIRNDVRTTLYGYRKHTTWQKVKADLIIIHSLIADILMIGIFGVIIYFIIGWIIDACKWCIGLFQ
ncbi:MAG: hypothetical protein K2H47_05320 [Muribaculaceae bacterium]|nr:hypothetical protein [Muribaculaceae bacterium]